MAAPATTIPLTIEPEAAAHIAELGMQTEFEQMLEHTRQTLPGLHSIRVWLADPYDTGDESGVVIQPTIDPPPPGPHSIDWVWGGWFVDTFPPDVCRHFCMLSIQRTANAR
jgi:hypothetical protein